MWFYFMFFPQVAWLVVFIIIAAIAFAAFRIITKIRKAPKKVVTLDDMPESVKKDLLIGLRDNASRFAGLYEPLHEVSEGNSVRREEVVSSWYKALHNINGNGAFKRAFYAYFGKESDWNKSDYKAAKNAYKLIRFLAKAGVTRNEDKVVTANDLLPKRYVVSGAKPIEIGMNYTVVVPYWFIGDKILVKGIVL